MAHGFLEVQLHPKWGGPLAFEYEIGWPNEIVGTNVDLLVSIALEAFQGCLNHGVGVVIFFE